MNPVGRILIALSFIPFAIPLYAGQKEAPPEKAKKEAQILIQETRNANRAEAPGSPAGIAQLQGSQSSPDNEPEKEETPKIDIEDIFQELTPAEEELPPAAKGKETEEEAIAREVGQYEAPKFPWFPALLSPYMGVMIDVPAQFTTQEGEYEDANRIDMREAELNFYSNVDPFVRAFAMVTGAEEVSVEEAYLQTSSLPHDLQVRGGKFFANLGRLNKTHTHDLPFFDQPLTMQNFLGNPEPEENQEVFLSYEPQYVGEGAEILWLAPTDFYWRLFFGTYNEFSDRGPGSFYAQYLGIPGGFRSRNRGLNDFSYSLGSRWFFELGDDHSIRIDAYGIYDAPNDDLRRTLEMLALTYRWYPLEYGLYRGMEWTIELFANQERFLETVTNLEDQNTWGIYSYIHYKLDNRFSISLLGGSSQFRFDGDAGAWQVGSALSYQPSERHRIRLQISYIDEQEWKDSVSNTIGLPPGDGAFWEFIVQWTAVMGSHMHTYE